MFHDAISNVLLFVANAGWCMGSWAVGSHKRWGFLVSFACEAVWLAYAFMSGTLWGLGPWCLVGFVVYGRNWWTWTAGRRNGHA